jgi:hypothetical protein
VLCTLELRLLVNVIGTATPSWLKFLVGILYTLEYCVDWSLRTATPSWLKFLVGILCTLEYCVDWSLRTATPSWLKFLVGILLH